MIPKQYRTQINVCILTLFPSYMNLDHIKLTLNLMEQLKYHVIRVGNLILLFNHEKDTKL